MRAYNATNSPSYVERDQIVPQLGGQLENLNFCLRPKLGFEGTAGEKKGAYIQIARKIA